MQGLLLNLKSKPFENRSDTEFLWPVEKLKEALSLFRRAILDNQGFLLLTGEAGVGKTSLCHALTGSLDSNVVWSVIANPSLERIDFYKAIFNGFGIERECESKVQFFIGFSHFLHTSHDDNKKIVLLVDECHLLSQDMLEDLLLLSNIAKGDGKLINILFAGESTFEDMLGLFNEEAEKKVLPLKVELSTLNSNETDESISPTSACPAGKKGRGWLISALLLITLILVGSYFLTPNY